MIMEKTKVKKKKKIHWARFIPIYIMMLPGLAYLIINNFLPMFGVVIAFKDLNFRKGILASDWAGFDNFKYLFATKDAWTITRNTLGYNILFIILATVIGVALAILLNEVRAKLSLKVFMTCILIPYLLSYVIVNYLAYAYLAPDTGLINNTILKAFGMDGISWYTAPQYWPYIIVFVYIWKSIGYAMVLYYSSILGISQEYYEAAALDGATKWQQIKNVTLPLLKPTIITLFILNVGRIFNSDFGLFYQVTRNSGMLYSTTRTIDVYVYNALMNNNDYAMSSAASVYQSVVGCITLIVANFIIRKVQPEDAMF